MNSLDIMDDELSQEYPWLSLLVKIHIGVLVFIFILDDFVDLILDKLNYRTAPVLVIGLAVFWFVVVVPFANAWGRGESLEVYRQKETDVDTSEDSVWDKVE